VFGEKNGEEKLNVNPNQTILRRSNLNNLYSLYYFFF